MKYTNPSQINEKEIIDLVKNNVIESTHLDYKQEITYSSDAEKKELLADVCAFANCGGGLIVYGINEERDADNKTNGVPDTILGLSLNIDELILKLDSSIRQSIEPQIMGLKIIPLITEGKNIICIFIPRSFNSPHMVTFKGTDRFWNRSNSGKYPMNLQEIKNTILNGDDLIKKIRNFREIRVGKILNSQAPMPLMNNPLLVSHFVPIELFSGSTSFDFSSIDYSMKANFIPFDALHTGGSLRINFDGFCNYVEYTSPNEICSYSQVFRNLSIEGVNAIMFGDIRNQKMFSGLGCAKLLIQYLEKIKRNFKKLEVKGPGMLFVSILGAKGYKMVNDNNLDFFNKGVIDQMDLLFPEIFIEDLENFESNKILQPAMDLLWNSSGKEKSPIFDIQGNPI